MNCTTTTTPTVPWESFQFLTCSVLPVRMACNLSCPFCFSKSSISNKSELNFHHYGDTIDWYNADIDGYYAYAKQRGAKRLVITGGGEPLLRPEITLYLIQLGRKHFDEITCFTNGTFLTASLARKLQASGLDYLCYSRHSHDDATCKELMGKGAPKLSEFFEAAGDISVRATCVMAKGYVDSTEKVWEYIETLAPFGVTEFTFKHTYVTYEQSVFSNSEEDQWATQHQVEFDPFEGQGETLLTLPWGPKVRKIRDLQVCYYQEPTPIWEQTHQLCRSSNLLSNGKVYASLEDQQSLLFQLNNSSQPSQPKK